MATFRILEHISPEEIRTIAEDSPHLQGLSRRLVREHGLSETRARTFVERLLTTVLDDFGERYTSEMSARIDRIVRIREQITSVYDSVLQGKGLPEGLTPQGIESLFQHMQQEMSGLKSPTQHLLEDPPLIRDDIASRALTSLGHEAPEPGPVLVTTLGRLVGPREVLAPKGLDVVYEQTAAHLLEGRLNELAASDPATAKALLTGIGRHLEAGHVQELQGLDHFLEVGGKPETLAVILGNGRIRGTADTRIALRAFKSLTADQVRGIDVIVETLGAGPVATDTIVGIGANFDPPGGVFGALGEIAPHTDAGLNEVMRYLRSFSSPNLNQAGLGSLRGALAALKENPGSRITFEEPVLQQDRLVRVLDFRLKLPSGDPLEYLQGEIKEVQDIRILKVGRSVRQFAFDVRLQADNAPPAQYGVLARLRWLIRRPAHPDGTLFTDAELLPVRTELKGILRNAFDDPLLRGDPRRAQVLNEFDTNFDQIVRFF
jgi:hypothetical protein